jgi:tRNA pseudouridine38-40 synthase
MAVLLTVAYHGAPFAGFAPQPSQRTVAGELLGALRAVDPSIHEIRGASRTDAGVHARGQRVAFDPVADIPPRGWVLATTRHLPPEIAVRRASIVAPGFSPRFASTGKRYRYLLFTDPVRDPFLEGRAWRVEDLADGEALDRARRETSLALGTHDFAAFRSRSDERQNTTRTLTRLTIEPDPEDPRILRVDVHGSAFLHNMVRILVGTLVDVARGRLEPLAVARALATRNRREAGITAPAEGLYLEHVELPDEGTDAWPAPLPSPPGGEGGAPAAPAP